MRPFRFSRIADIGSCCRDGSWSRPQGPTARLRPASLRGRAARSLDAVGRPPALDHRAATAGECGADAGATMKEKLDWDHTNESIPPDHIGLADAFEEFYRKSIPDWEERLAQVKAA